MIAAMIEKANSGRVATVADPEPGPHDVLVEVANAGICGTDLHIWNGEYALARYPLIPGHEFSGVVAEVGREVRRFEPGDRVTADPNLPCNACRACQRNEQNQCENLAAVGVTRSGAFARYVAVPESSVFPIGELPFSAAAMVEPLACVVWGLQRVAPEPGHRALLFGAGPMGCLLLQALNRSGAASVTVVDRAEGRLALASRLGAAEVIAAGEAGEARLREVTGRGFDLVVDATGVPAVIEAAVDYVRPRGTLWLFGVAPSGAAVRFSPYHLFRNDLRLIGTFALNKTFPQSIALIRSGAVQVEPLVSHLLPLSEFVEGMRVAEHDPGRMKVQFRISDG
jgi:D-arabinitol dehydrogenase (NADP+)